MIPDLGDRRKLSALNFNTPLLPCKICNELFNREERVDCINDADEEESFCVPHWFDLCIG